MPASVDLLQPSLSVMPGQFVSATIRLVNTGRIVDELTLEVLGDAAGFATVEPARVPLFPGAQADATVTFRPPRGPQPGSGVIPFAIRVRSQEDRAFSFVAEGRLQIGVLMDVGARLTPRTSTGSRLGQGGRHRIEVDNNSNTTARIRVAATDPDERLTFQIADPVLTIPPGGRIATTIGVKGRKRMVTGAPASLPFQVFIAPDGGAPITLDGSLTQRATLVGGANQILALAVVVGVVGLLATQILPMLSPAATQAPTAPVQTITGGVSQPPVTPPPTPAPSIAVPTAPPTAAPTPTVPPTAAPTPTPTPTPTPEPTPSQTPSPTPSPTPFAIQIFNLGLIDPAGQSIGNPTPGGSWNPQNPFAKFPVFGADQLIGLPLQQVGLSVAGPIAAAITLVSDQTSPRLCISRDETNRKCLTDASALVGQTSDTGPVPWYLSILGQQGGTSVDLKIQYPPQPVTFAFEELHLAGGLTTAGVHFVFEASGNGVIAVRTRVDIAADVTVVVKDLTVATPDQTITFGAGDSGPWLGAATAGHFYDVVLSSTSQDDAFVSGTISWP